MNAPALIGLSAELADKNSELRVELDAELGARSFRAFVKMAWPHFDPAHLSWNWHADLICDEMQAAAARQITELVCCVPPRSMKSSIIGVCFPAWVWTWYPAAKFITASYEMRLATRDAVRHRGLVRSEWYQRRWGPNSPYRPEQNLLGSVISADEDQKTFFETTSGGYRFVCTPTSNVTGWGADFILADDPNPVNKAESPAERLTTSLWWWETIPTRLNDPARGVKMIIQQRVHEEDLAGQAIARGWHRVVLPMRFDPDHPDRHPKDPRTVAGEVLHPDRVSDAAVRKLERDMGEYSAAGQLQQTPRPRSGGLFKRAKFVIVDAIPGRVVSRVRKWDLASTEPTVGTDPDYTVGLLMARLEDGRYLVENVERFRLGPDGVKEALKAIATQDGKMVPIILPQDPGQAGKAQAADLTRHLAGWPVRAEAETGDKWVRAQPVAAQQAAGNILLLRADWNKEFINELAAFPNASHDDQVDAFSGAFLGFFGAGAGMMDYYAELMQQLEEDIAGQRADAVAIRTQNSAKPLPDDDEDGEFSGFG